MLPAVISYGKYAVTHLKHNMFVCGCLVYADAILLLSASLWDQRRMIDLCCIHGNCKTLRCRCRCCRCCHYYFILLFYLFSKKRGAGVTINPGESVVQQNQTAALRQICRILSYEYL